MRRIILSALQLATALAWTLHKAVRNIAYSLESKKLQPACSYVWRMSRATYQIHVWILGVAYRFERWSYRLTPVQAPEIFSKLHNPLHLIGLNIWGVARFACIVASVGVTAWILAYVIGLLTK